MTRSNSSSLKFDLVVLGNEPAALWLLSQLEKRIPGIRLGWIQIDWSLREPTAIDRTLSDRFDIPRSDPWSIEISLPDANFLWREDALELRFPGLSGMLKSSTSYAACLRRYPDLVGFCQGIWKRLGRSQNLGPEALLHLVHHTQFQWWNQAPEVTTFPLDAPETLGRLETLERGEIQMQLADSSWDTQHLVIATTPEELRRLSSRHSQLGDWVSIPERLEHEAGVVAWTLSFKTNYVPAGLPPIVLIYAFEVIPCPQTEILAIDYRDNPNETQLTLWLPASRPFSRTALAEHARAAFDLVSDRMPMARHGVIGQVPRLLEPFDSSVETAGDPDECLDKSIEARFIPDFSTSRLHDFHTRHRQVSWISTDHHCHRIYPQGALETAQKLANHLVAQAGSNARISDRDTSPASPPSHTNG